MSTFLHYGSCLHKTLKRINHFYFLFFIFYFLFYVFLGLTGAQSAYRDIINCPLIYTESLYFLHCLYTVPFAISIKDSLSVPFSPSASSLPSHYPPLRIHHSKMCFCCCDILCCDCILVILAVFFPPLPVCIKRGLCSCDLLINICLCTLGWVPGMIHAWYIILSDPYVVIDDEERQIFIVTPQPSSSVVVNKRPDQTRIRFTHPEPFAESLNSVHSKNNNDINNQNPSPLSSPIPQSNYIPSPLGQANYGTIANDEEVDPNTDLPPDYESAMNETAKQFR